jgi:hypothetical protein
VDALKLPEAEQEKAFAVLEKEAENKSFLMSEPLPHLLAHVKEMRGPLALRRCAQAAVAAERLRLAKNSWPETLDALTHAGLPDVPADPYNARPLRLKRVADGLIIYSLGPDGIDHDGAIDREGKKPATNFGFRLWDESRRRSLHPFQK